MVSSLINGTLHYALGELASLPRAAVVVEDRYSQVFKLDWVRPATIADGLADTEAALAERLDASIVREEHGGHARSTTAEHE